MFAIGLHNPKNPINVGHVLRAADAYGAAAVCVSGSRISARSSTDVSCAYRRIPVLRGNDLQDLIPFSCIPVVIELRDDAEDLRTFEHPANAFYVFGAEDATPGEKTLSWCPKIVYTPTRICMNLGACANVVLYDRLAKRGHEKQLPAEHQGPKPEC
jgi:tRNA(Leu) C34 or U34 (ribose-2'-O)-methylase TrmL